MVALLASVIGTVAVSAGVFWYARRRPVGTPISWGEAMGAATYVFFLMFLIYGVVPHQWLTLADSEWSWRPDRIVFGPGDILEPDKYIPFTITYLTLRDAIAAGIYIVGLGLQIWMWAAWQNRDKTAEKRAEIAPSRYGRPLVKQG